VNSEKISASFKNDVLSIVLPKSEDAKKKEIKIKVESEEDFPLLKDRKEGARRGAFFRLPPTAFRTDRRGGKA